MTLNNIMARAAQVAMNVARRATATAITVTRDGAAEPAEIVVAGRGQSVWEFALAGDALTSQERREDFLIDPPDYDFGDGPVEPAEGDRIAVDDGQTITTYEVNAPPPEPAWRYTDRFRTALRVHARVVAEEPS